MGRTTSGTHDLCSPCGRPLQAGTGCVTLSISRKQTVSCVRSGCVMIDRVGQHRLRDICSTCSSALRIFTCRCVLAEDGDWARAWDVQAAACAAQEGQALAGRRERQQWREESVQGGAVLVRATRAGTFVASVQPYRQRASSVVPLRAREVTNTSARDGLVRTWCARFGDVEQIVDHRAAQSPPFLTDDALARPHTRRCRTRRRLCTGQRANTTSSTPLVSEFCTCWRLRHRLLTDCF